MKNDFKDLYLEELSKPSYWRLFIDGCKQKSTSTEQLEYKTGYLFWMLREIHGLKCLQEAASDLINNKLNDRITWDFLIELNKKSFPFSDHLKFDNGDNLSEGRIGLKTPCPNIFGELVNEKDMDYVDYKALSFQKKINYSEVPWGVQEVDGVFQIFSFMPLEKLKKSYDSTLKEYEKKIEFCKSKNLTDMLILTIVDFLQNLELLHIFKDGNCRELCLILNKELIKNGLCPTILNDPNDLDFKDPKDLLEEVKIGQKAFEMLVDKGVPYSDALSFEEIKKNIAMLGDKKIPIGQKCHLYFNDENGYEKISVNKLYQFIPAFYKELKEGISICEIAKKCPLNLTKNDWYHRKFIQNNIKQEGNDNNEDALLNLKKMYAVVNAYNQEIALSEFTDIDNVVSMVDTFIENNLKHGIIGDVFDWVNLD